ncbi:MAG: hypothetical protein GY696_13120 [Gammaproteobacteria bacterium]|nr:hypothetical protein [Gammaproteobacteria bacterium]
MIRVFFIPWCYPLALASEQGQAIAVAMQQSLNFLIYIGISAQFRKAVMAVLRRQDLAHEGPLSASIPTGSTRGPTMSKLVGAAGSSQAVAGVAQDRQHTKNAMVTSSRVEPLEREIQELRVEL